MSERLRCSVRATSRPPFQSSRTRPRSKPGFTPWSWARAITSATATSLGSVIANSRTTGWSWNAPENQRNFRLGGGSGLRGYKSGFAEGNAFYRLAGEWARPVWRPWLRTVVIAEAGNVYARPDAFDPAEIKASLGLGVRLRLPVFVNVELEAGIALPVDGGEMRFFAGRV